MNYPLAPDYEQLSNDYHIVEQALHFLQENYQRQPDLKEIAASVGYSEYHFQRLFTRWVGISPKRFLQFLTKQHICQLLENASSLLDASYQVGLSGSGRLYDLFIACEAVTPGEYKNHGAGLTISYAFHPTPFGECLLAVTDRGICGLSFIGTGEAGSQDALSVLSRRWSQANLIQDSSLTGPVIQQIFSLPLPSHSQPLRLLLHGTNFQIKVWEALLHIPPASVVAYEHIADFIGFPHAARAVSRAVASNPIAYLIPCHRVIRKMGVIGGYQWGVFRKQAILGWEMAQGAV